MARGWESKSVEEQQAELLEKKQTAEIPRNPEQIEKQRLIEGLRMSRTRLLTRLQTAQNPGHRQMLERALADINAQLSRLD